MNASSSIITFRIDVNFPNCEVDMALKEAMASGVRTPVPSILCDGAIIPIEKSKLPDTPTSASVNFCLNWLMGFVDRNEMKVVDSKWETDYSKSPITATTESGMKYSTYPTVKTELEKIGLKVDSIYGLMQGTCHLICSCFIEDFKPELIKEAEKVVESVFKKFVQYYDLVSN
jgi:hypothetical protein